MYLCTGKGYIHKSMLCSYVCTQFPQRGNQLNLFSVKALVSNQCIIVLCCFGKEHFEVRFWVEKHCTEITFLHWSKCKNESNKCLNIWYLNVL
jgi:hypothetical protein